MESNVRQSLHHIPIGEIHTGEILVSDWLNSHQFHTGVYRFALKAWPTNVGIRSRPMVIKCDYFWHDPKAKLKILQKQGTLFLQCACVRETKPSRKMIN